MLTRLFLSGRARAISPKLENVLADYDNHLLQDMGLLRDPANRLMRAPAEFFAYDTTKFAGKFDSQFGGPKAA
jgi:hypothetical protein